MTDSHAHDSTDDGNHDHSGKPVVDNHIQDPRARTFVAALRRFEQSADPTDLTALFAPDATLTRLDARGERGDPAAFWREYRAQFHQLSTTFTNVVEAADEFALEWSTEATLTNDRAINYRGVTVIRLDGEHITALRTYYDTAAFATPTPSTSGSTPAQTQVAGTSG